MADTSGGVKSDCCSKADADDATDAGEDECWRQPGRDASVMPWHVLDMDDATDDVDRDGDAGA